MAGHVFDVQFDTVGDGLVENADIRIYGYADMRICGYTDMRILN